MLDNVDSDVTRRHQRDKIPRWCRREHATAGADQTPGPRPVTLSSEGRPLLAVSGSSWGPARCVVASSLDSVWSSAIAGVQGTGACSRLSPPVPGPRGGRGHTCRTPPRACSVSNATSLSVSARLSRRRRTCCNRGCGTCVVGLFAPLGVAVQRRPREYQRGDGGLGRWPSGHVKKGAVPDTTGVQWRQYRRRTARLQEGGLRARRSRASISIF